MQKPLSQVIDAGETKQVQGVKHLSIYLFPHGDIFQLADVNIKTANYLANVKNISDKAGCWRQFAQTAVCITLALNTTIHRAGLF
jgi:hypothetical protein